MYLILPVPVVFLLMAFWLQLTADRQELVSGRGGSWQVRRSCEGTSKEFLLALLELEGSIRVCSSHLRILAAGYPHEEHVLFWMWNDLLPQRLQRVCVLLWRLPAHHKFSAQGALEMVPPSTVPTKVMRSSSSPKLPVPFPFFPILPRCGVTKRHCSRRMEQGFLQELFAIVRRLRFFASSTLVKPCIGSPAKNSCCPVASSAQHAICRRSSKLRLQCRFIRRHRAPQ